MNNRKITYLRIFGIAMISTALVLFLFPEKIQDASNSMSIDEKIDFKIRYSAIPLAIGIFSLIITRFNQESMTYKLLIFVLAIDFGYFVTRLIALAIYDFDSSVQFVWLLVEIIIAVVLLYVLKLKAPRRPKPSKGQLYSAEYISS